MVTDVERSHPHVQALRGTHTVKTMFAGKNFRRLYRSRIFAQLSDGAFQTSLAGSVIFNPQHASSPADLAAGFAVLLLPYSIVGPFVGVFLDRLSRRHLMVITTLLRTLVGVSVALLIWGGGVSNAQVAIYAAALIALSLSRFFLSALSASLPHVVDRSTLVSANAFTTTSGTISSITGGGIAIGLLTIFGRDDHGYALVCLITVVGTAIACMTMMRFGADTLGPTDAERVQHRSLGSILSGMYQGAVHLWERPACNAALIAVSLHRLIFGGLSVGLLLLFKVHIHPDGFLRADIAGVGQSLAFGGVGAMIAALVTPAVTRDIGKSRWIALCIGIGGTVSMLLLIPANGWLVLAAAFLAGFAGQGAKVCSDTIIQESIEDSYRGRVFTVYDTLFNASFVIGVVIGAFTLPNDGVSWLFFSTCAVLYAATGVGYRYISKRDAHG